MKHVDKLQQKLELALITLKLNPKKVKSLSVQVNVVKQAKLNTLRNCLGKYILQRKYLTKV